MGYYHTFKFHKQVVENLRLLLFQRIVLSVKSHEVLKQRVQVRVQFEERDLLEVRVVDMCNHVKQVSVNAADHTLKCRREDISCKYRKMKFYFLKIKKIQDTSPFCGASDTPRSGDVSSGFPNQRAALFALGGGIHVTGSQTFTSGVTPAALSAASMAAEPFSLPHTCD